MAAKTDALPDMPAKPDKAPRSETLFIAHTPANADASAYGDVVVFGRKLDALEFAMDQDPAWKVRQVAKGQRLSEAVTGA